jgi:hypothetical protein
LICGGRGGTACSLLLGTDEFKQFLSIILRKPKVKGYLGKES